MTSLSFEDLKYYKLEFYKHAIEHLKSELRAEEVKDLKKEQWFKNISSLPKTIFIK